MSDPVTGPTHSPQSLQASYICIIVITSDTGKKPTEA